MFGHTLALHLRELKPVLCVIQHEPIKESFRVA